MTKTKAELADLPPEERERRYWQQVTRDRAAAAADDIPGENFAVSVHGRCGGANLLIVSGLSQCSVRAASPDETESARRRFPTIARLLDFITEAQKGV